MWKAMLRWSAALGAAGAMACASTHQAPAAGAPRAEAGKYVTKPKEEPFPFLVTKAPVKIDGDLSDWPADLPVGKVSSADGSHVVVFRTFAQGDRIYAAFQVTDPTPTLNKQNGGSAYDGGAIEFFLGTHDASHGDWAENDVQVFITYDPTRPHVYNNVATKVMGQTQVVERTTADGWLVEASFTVADLGILPPAPGKPVWLDVALDNSNGGARSSQFWWIGDGGSWKNPSTWKKTSFVAAP